MTPSIDAGAPRTAGPIDKAAFAVALAVNAVVLFAPAGGGVPLLPYADKLVHVGVFALVAGTGVRAGVRPRTLGLALVAYAVSSEIVQAVALPARTGDPLDAVADSVGIAIGLGLGRWSVARLRPKAAGVLKTGRGAVQRSALAVGDDGAVRAPGGTDG